MQPQSEHEDPIEEVRYIVTIEGETSLWQKFVGLDEIERTRDRLTPLQFREEYEVTFGRRRTDREAPGDRTAWLTANGYTDPFQNEGQWWAFPPNGVMPVPLREATLAVSAQQRAAARGA